MLRSKDNLNNDVIICVKISLHFSFQSKQVHKSVWPWYEFAFSPERTVSNMVNTIDYDSSNNSLVSELVAEMNRLTKGMIAGVHVDEVVDSLGRGKQLQF